MVVEDERVWSTWRAGACGVPWNRRRGRLLVRVTRGSYVHTADSAETDAVLVALLDAVPTAVLSHWTAAAVWGAPVDRARAVPWHVSVPTGTTRPVRARVVSHHAADLPTSTVRGLRVTDPSRTWLDLAAAGASTADLVVVGDAFGRLGLASPEQLGEVALLPRRRGSQRMRAAAALLDPRAESGPESRLRLMLVAGGLPAPEVNHVVTDGRGAFLARVDLAWPEAMLVVEYDGDHHRERQQWVHDLRRRERLEAAGWTVVVVTAADLREPRSALVERVAARYRTGPARRSA